MAGSCLFYSLLRIHGVTKGQNTTDLYHERFSLRRTTFSLFTANTSQTDEQIDSTSSQPSSVRNEQRNLQVDGPSTTQSSIFNLDFGHDLSRFVCSFQFPPLMILNTGFSFPTSPFPVRNTGIITLQLYL